MNGEIMNSDTKGSIVRSEVAAAGIALVALLAGCGGTTAAPVITSVSPQHLSPAGGTAVTINGKNFHPNDLVMFGNYPAPQVQWVNSTSIIATSPKYPSMDTVAVNVGSASLANAVTYDLDGITCDSSADACTYAADAYFNSYGSGTNIQTCTGSPDNNAVGNINADGSNWVIVNDVQVPTTGNYTMTVYGGTMQQRHFAVYVNGSTNLIDVYFPNPSDSSWYVPVAATPVEVPLVAGQNNSIMFTGNPDSTLPGVSYWAPNLCYVTIAQ